MRRATEQFWGKILATPFTAPAVMPHSPDGNLTYDILKYMLTQPGFGWQAGIDDTARLQFTSSEESAQLLWKNLQEASANTGASMSLEAYGIDPNHLIVPDLSNIDGPIPADPNGTPFFVPANPVDDPNGDISYDRWKSLIANPETRAMLGLDDKTASWLMRSEEGAFMWFQQAKANENQAHALDTQASMQQMTGHLNDGFKYAKLAGIAALVVGVCFIFLVLTR